MLSDLNTAPQLVLEGLHMWRVYQHCSVSPNLRQVLILWSLAIFFPSLSSHLWNFSISLTLSKFSEIQKSRSLLSFVLSCHLYCFLDVWRSIYLKIPQDWDFIYLSFSLSFGGVGEGKKKEVLSCNSQQRTSKNHIMNKLCEVREYFRKETKERVGSGMDCMVASSWF